MIELGAEFPAKIRKFPATAYWELAKNPLGISMLSDVSQDCIPSTVHNSQQIGFALGILSAYDCSLSSRFRARKTSDCETVLQAECAENECQKSLDLPATGILSVPNSEAKGAELREFGLGEPGEA
ncbi:MAG: hypothetical protein O9296_14510 [Novosphingobium sp.]|nr:hypothetical protein [Novosphingobium sp.]